MVIVLSILIFNYQYQKKNEVKNLKKVEKENFGIMKPEEIEIFEINPRHSGTTYIRSLFGYFEVVYILKYLLEGLRLNFVTREGKVMRFFEEKYLP